MGNHTTGFKRSWNVSTTGLAGVNSVYYKLNIINSKESNSSKELIATLNIRPIEQETTPLGLL